MDLLVYSGALLFVLLHVLGLTLLLLHSVAHLERALNLNFSKNTDWALTCSLTVEHCCSLTVEHCCSLTVEHCCSFTVEHCCSFTVLHTWDKMKSRVHYQYITWKICETSRNASHLLIDCVLNSATLLLLNGRALLLVDGGALLFVDRVALLLLHCAALLLVHCLVLCLTLLLVHSVALLLWHCVANLRRTSLVLELQKK